MVNLPNDYCIADIPLRQIIKSINIQNVTIFSINHRLIANLSGKIMYFKMIYFTLFSSCHLAQEHEFANIEY